MTWIKCTDRMPPEYSICLITIEMKYDWEDKVERDVDLAQYKPGEGGIDGDWETTNDWDEGQQHIKVTHWMPMPRPAED